MIMILKQISMLAKDLLSSAGVKSSIGLFISSSISGLIAYIVTPIYTRLLPSDIFGRCTLFSNWYNIFGIFAMFCLSYGVFNSGMCNYPNKRNEYSFSMLMLSNCISTVVFILIIITYRYTKDFINLDYKFLILMYIIFLFQPAFNFWITKEKYEYKYKKVLFVSVFLAFLSPSMAIYLIHRSKDLFAARIFGAYIPHIVVWIILYFYLASKSHFCITTKYWKEALAFNAPLIPHYLSLYLLVSVDKIMISKLINESVTAYYSIAYTVASFTLLIWNAINSSLVPYTFDKIKNDDFKSIQNTSTIIVTLFSCISLLLVFIAPEIVSVIAPSEYRSAVYVIPPLIVGVSFQIHYFLYANILFYYKQTRYVMYGSITASVVNIVLNYIFIKKFGYYAAAYTSLISYIVQASIDYIGMKHVVKIKFYNIKVILLIGVLFSSFSLLTIVFYECYLARFIYFFCCIIVIAFIFKRLVCKQMFNNISFDRLFS